MRAGFIGLGNIGAPMALNIAESGFALTVYDARAEAAAEAVARGAHAAASPREVAQRSDVIGVCVRDDAQVEEVVTGKDGLLGGLQRDAIVVIHSTIRPNTVRRLAGVVQSKGASLSDAPITGGAPGAMSRSLCYMVGGEAALIERCRPVFETSASKIVHTGALGSGAATKLCNNLMMYMGFLAVFEATELAAAAGLSQEKLFEVVRANGVLTAPMEAYLSLRNGIRARGLDPGMRPFVEGFAALADKDLQIALEAAQEHGAHLPGGERCREQMRRVYGVE